MSLLFKQRINFDLGRDSAPERTGGAYSAAPDTLTEFKGAYVYGEGRGGNAKGGNGMGSPTHVCLKNLWGQSCRLLKIRKTSQNKLVESMHYCIQKLTFKLCDKNWTEHGHLAFHFDPVGWPHKFFRTGPTGWRRGSVVGRRSLAGGLSLIYAWSMVHMWPLRGYSVRCRSTNQANSAFHPYGVGKWFVIHVITCITRVATIKRQTGAAYGC